MSRARVLIVDDSAVVRRLIADAIAASPDLIVAGIAPDGRTGLERLAACAPDVVTLDLEMPILDGIGMLRELRRTHPRLPVLMLSSHTERGALATLDALAVGASDFVAKPAAGGPEEARLIRLEVLPRLRALASRAVLAPAPTTPAPPTPALPARRAGGLPGQVEVVVMGVSTGGPQALERVVPRLPRGFPVPVAVVQHMPPMFTRLLADRLASLGPLPVREAEDGAPFRSGQVWMAPGGRHLSIVRGPAGAVLAVGDGPPENSCRPAADVLFRSAAEIYGRGVLAVVLTGMGRDGTEGCRRIRAAGGSVLVQDAETSVVWGMPGAVAQAGLAEALVPLDDVAREIAVRVGRGALWRPGVAAGGRTP